MPQLRGLPGRRSPIDCERFTSPAMAATILARGIGAVASGENGAITVWPTKHGIRMELQRFCVVIEDFSYASVEAAAPVLSRWLREIRKPNARCAAIKRKIRSGDVSAILGVIG